MELSLADNQVTSKTAEQFFDVLSSMPNLVSLDLSENCLDDASATYIADLLLVYLNFLILLYCYLNEFKSIFNDAGLKKIQNRYLKSLEVMLLCLDLLLFLTFSLGQ